MAQQGTVILKEITVKEVEMVSLEVVEADTTTAIGVATLSVMVGNRIMAIKVEKMTGMAIMTVAEVEEPLKHVIDVAKQGIQPQIVLKI